MTDYSESKPLTDLELRKRLRTLLANLPDWQRVDDRITLVKDALGDHLALRNLELDGAPVTVASRVIDRVLYHRNTPMEDGHSPVCGVLSVIEERGLASADAQSELDALAEFFACRKSTLEQRLAAAGSAAIKNPFPGLRTLRVDESNIFFGRELETHDLLQKLQTAQGQRLIVVTGASGSGKSSLVRAGLWAALENPKRSPLTGSAQWVITELFPTGDTTAFHALLNGLRVIPGLPRIKTDDLARQLFDTCQRYEPVDALLQTLLDQVMAGRSPEAQWLVVLDQLEELFTAPALGFRDAFIHFLIESINHPRFRVIATVRDDFYHQLLAYEGLRAELNAGAGYSLGTPGEFALARMIQGPAETAEINAEPALVAALVADAAHEPGGLALLAAALQDLHRLAENTRTLRLTHYREALGGLKAVIMKRAEMALTDLVNDGIDVDAVLPRVFVHLLTVDARGTATRLRTLASTWEHDPSALKFIDRFSGESARLLVGSRNTDGQPTVEIAHEAMLREWCRLAEWIQTKAQALRLRGEVMEAAVRHAQAPQRYPRWPHERLDPERRLLAEAGLLETLEQSSVAVADFLRPEADILLAKLNDAVTIPGEREEIGRRLAVIGDPRPGVGVVDGLPDIRWRKIPAGEIEIDGKQFSIKPFAMAAYPVTWAQYRAFIEASDGYADQRHWKQLQREKQPGTQLRRYDNHPADNVSWHDAMAFSRWLSKHLNQEIRLPTEWEWQWAAQSGLPDYAYPWGKEWQDNHANTDETGIGRTTAVGCFPLGVSRQGVYDLAGNVWEWCINEYDNMNNIQPGGDKTRSLRGGSWGSDQGGARADDRGINHPDFRFNFYGFRVVLVSPIVDTDH